MKSFLLIYSRMFILYNSKTLDEVNTIIKHEFISKANISGIKHVRILNKAKTI